MFRHSAMRGSVMSFVGDSCFRVNTHRHITGSGSNTSSSMARGGGNASGSSGIGGEEYMDYGVGCSSDVENGNGGPHIDETTPDSEEGPHILLPAPLEDFPSATRLPTLSPFQDVLPASPPPSPTSYNRSESPPVDDTAIDGFHSVCEWNGGEERYSLRDVAALWDLLLQDVFVFVNEGLLPIRERECMSGEGQEEGTGHVSSSIQATPVGTRDEDLCVDINRDADGEIALPLPDDSSLVAVSSFNDLQHVMNEVQRQLVDVRSLLLSIQETHSVGGEGGGPPPQAHTIDPPALTRIDSSANRLYHIIVMALISHGGLPLIYWDDAMLLPPAYIQTATDIIIETLRSEQKAQISLRELSELWRMSMNDVYVLCDWGVLMCEPPSEDCLGSPVRCQSVGSQEVAGVPPPYPTTGGGGAEPAPNPTRRKGRGAGWGGGWGSGLNSFYGRSRRRNQSAVSASVIDTYEIDGNVSFPHSPTHTPALAQMTTEASCHVSPSQGLINEHWLVTLPPYTYGPEGIGADDVPIPCLQAYPSSQHSNSRHPHRQASLQLLQSILSTRLLKLSSLQSILHMTSADFVIQFLMDGTEGVVIGSVTSGGDVYVFPGEVNKVLLSCKLVPIMTILNMCLGGAEVGGDEESFCKWLCNMEDSAEWPPCPPRAEPSIGTSGTEGDSGGRLGTITGVGAVLGALGLYHSTTPQPDRGSVGTNRGSSSIESARNEVLAAGKITLVEWQEDMYIFMNTVDEAIELCNEWKRVTGR